MNNSKAISGTELVEGVLGGPDVDRLLKDFDYKEHAVLEFKASWKPCEGDDASEDDCRWNVIKAVIAMANASGGCIILGLAENKSAVEAKGKSKLLAGEYDPDGILKNREDKDLIAHTRKELFKGNGEFYIGKNDHGKHVKILNEKPMDALGKKVDFQVCKCKTINKNVIVMLVRPIEDEKEENYIFVEEHKRVDNVDERNLILYHRAAKTAETQAVVGGMDFTRYAMDIARYAKKREIRRKDYAQMLKHPKNEINHLLLVVCIILFFVVILEFLFFNCTNAKNISAQFKAKISAVQADIAQRDENIISNEVFTTSQQLILASNEVATTKKEVRLARETMCSITNNAFASNEEIKRAREMVDEAEKNEKKAESDEKKALASAEDAKDRLEKARLWAQKTKDVAGEMKEKADTAAAAAKSQVSKLSKIFAPDQGVKDKQAEYNKTVKNRCSEFTDGLKTKNESVDKRFKKAREQQIPNIANKLSDESVVVNLVKNALDDQQGGKKDNQRLQSYIEGFITDFSASCTEACGKLVDDGKNDYERNLREDLTSFGKTIGQQIGSFPKSVFPEKVFEEDRKRIERTSEAIVRIVLKKGKSDIEYMGKHQAKWQELRFPNLQKELGPTVTSELNKIVDELQRDAVKHVWNAAEETQKAYLQAGDELVKAATKKPE